MMRGPARGRRAARLNEDGADHGRDGEAAGRRSSGSSSHTGQHYDVNMSDAFFADLALPAPDVTLGVGSGSHAEQTARVMMAIEPFLLQSQTRPRRGRR